MDVTDPKEDPFKVRNEELKAICLKTGVNHPLIGPENYNARSFDFSKQKVPFSLMIEQ